ncbi:MAG: hypothetical protein J6R40_01160, partial [Clostridia bacterium]|nr:hypothetical protein [Clostridia bacterium]
TGEISALKYIQENGKTSFSISLYDYDSALLFLPYEMEDTPLVQNKMQPKAIEFVPQEVPYSLSEPNVLLLENATYALDGNEPQGPEEILRADNALRDKLGFPRQTSHVAQPWVIEKKAPPHKVTLTFEIESEIHFDAPMLALEDAEVAQIVFNGQSVSYKDEGYYTDISIRKTALPPLRKGINTLQITLPYGERTNIEACYLLGDFGVSVLGTRKKVVALPKALTFDDISKQGLPFYGGEVRYHIPFFSAKAGDYALQIPHYRAGVLDVSIDEKEAETVAYPPYIAKMPYLTEGDHTVTLTVYISRHNCFGHIHCADEKLHWLGPDCWRTSGSAWTYGYRLREAGVLSTPLLLEM